MAHPYVGINGVTTIKEAAGVRKAFEDAKYFPLCPSTSHTPMTGFLVSDRTINGQIENARYPNVDKLKTMIMHASPCNPSIHYYTRDRDKLASQITQIYDMLEGAPFVNNLQINMTHPPIEELAKIKMKYPGIQLIIPVTKRSIVDNDPKKTALKMQPYRLLADYILIDLSGGRGEEISISYAVRLYDQLRKVMPDSVYGFAGGFTPENVGRNIRELSKRIKTMEFSIDVESGIRKRLSNLPMDDKLSLVKTRKFLKSAHNFLP